jgi:hypothetical protein
MHTIYLVQHTSPTLKLAAIDYAWLEKFLAERPEEIEHVVFNGRRMITAPTDEVQAFVVKHKDAFKAVVHLERAHFGNP